MDWLSFGYLLAAAVAVLIVAWFQQGRSGGRGAVAGDDGDQAQLGEEREPASALRRRDSLAGLVTVLAVGLAYGYGLAHFTAAPYADCGQSSPGIASLGAFAGGAVVGLFVLPLVAHGVHRVTVARSGVDLDVRWFVMVGAAIMGAVAGFLLHTALWPLPVKVPC